MAKIEFLKTNGFAAFPNHDTNFGQSLKLNRNLTALQPMLALQPIANTHPQAKSAETNHESVASWLPSWKTAGALITGAVVGTIALKFGVKKWRHASQLTQAVKPAGQNFLTRKFIAVRNFLSDPFKFKIDNITSRYAREVEMLERTAQPNKQLNIYDGVISEHTQRALRDILSFKFPKKFSMEQQHIINRLITSAKNDPLSGAQKRLKQKNMKKLKLNTDYENGKANLKNYKNEENLFDELPAHYFEDLAQIIKKNNENALSNPLWKLPENLALEKVFNAQYRYGKNRINAALVDLKEKNLLTPQMQNEIKSVRNNLRIMRDTNFAQHRADKDIFLLQDVGYNANQQLNRSYHSFYVSARKAGVKVDDPLNFETSDFYQKFPNEYDYFDINPF